ncbi:MAG: tRNA pseudouridine(38-40) synthase TruA [Candidatus Marinimicrobia bacterium]|nr:tRNA pseudouridine(38-40) synthase TruA [Candidatus Neomarinimicrobiota bacterium]
MTRYKLTIEYDGRNLHGWQIQNNVQTIQGEIEGALRDLNSSQRVVLHGAGRTDSGVHAEAQIAHFDLHTSLTENTIKNAINAKTPRSILIHKCEKVNSNFHSRFNAKRRYYKYKIWRGQTAIHRKYMWPVEAQLDVKTLRKCAETIKGEHDFKGFCRSSDEADHKICHIYKSLWKIRKKTLIYKICGNRFLHSMVRMLTGTMIEVARGRYEFQDFTNMLENKISNRSPYTAPAKGLYLENVEY